MTYRRSTPAQAVRRPTARATTSLCWNWRSPGSWGRDWEFSVGWSCTDKEMDAIQRLPKGAWTAGTDQNGNPIDDTFVADLTGLLDHGRWHNKIPGLRIIVRDEPLHPRYRKRATERDMQLGRRYQLIAINTNLG